MWHVGDVVLLRGIYNGQAHYVQSTRLVKDSPEETILLIVPGAECMVPKGYIQHGHDGQWDHWQEKLSNTLEIQKFIWHTNRFLVFLAPEKFYSTIYIWEDAKDRFDCFYINFQLPFHRRPFGFDTLDLDLDMVIGPSYEWRWKDVHEYQHGIDSGGIHPAWIKAVEDARLEVMDKVSRRVYPLHGTWLGWRPNPNWAPPCLPENWNQID